MKTIYPENSIRQFHILNQWDEKLQRMMCTFFAPAINLAYNCWIKLKESDLMLIAAEQVDKWEFDYKKWGYGLKWVDAVYEYIKHHASARWWKIPTLIKFTTWDNEEIKLWRERGFSILIGIKVTKQFLTDAKDWKINEYSDYINYKWTDLAHFTNLIKHFDDKEYINDSYAFNWKREWLYECNWDEIIEDIVMRSKYLFY